MGVKIKELVIGIPVHNEENLVLKCIENITKYTNGIDYEIWVFDNASTDGTVNSIRKTYPRVKIVRNKENIGYARALNRIILHTKSTYIALINPDIFIRDNIFNKILKFMKENPDIAITSPILNQPGQGLKRNFGIIFPNIFTIFIDYTGISRLFPKIIPALPTQVSYVEGAFMFIKRDIIKKYGLFDENIFIYMEDIDLQIRIKEKIFILPDIIADHLWGGGFPHSSISSIKRRIESLCYYFKKHRSKWEYMLLKLLLLIKRSRIVKEVCT